MKRLPALLRIGAVVLIAFAIAATSAASLDFLGITWTSWLCASILSWFVSNVLDEANA
jgi:hypothetical protein